MEFEPPLKLVPPLGHVRKDEELHETFIEILPEFRGGAIDGLREGGDWIKLVLWFHESDTPARRRVLKVHPTATQRTRSLEFSRRAHLTDRTR